MSCRVLSSLTWRLAACPLGAQQCTSYAKTGECVQALGPAQWQGASHNNRPMRHTRWAVRPPLPRASHPLPRAVRLPPLPAPAACLCRVAALVYDARGEGPRAGCWGGGVWAQAGGLTPKPKATPKLPLSYP